MIKYYLNEFLYFLKDTLVDIFESIFESFLDLVYFIRMLILKVLILISFFSKLGVFVAIIMAFLNIKEIINTHIAIIDSKYFSQMIILFIIHIIISSFIYIFKPKY